MIPLYITQKPWSQIKANSEKLQADYMTQVKVIKNHRTKAKSANLVTRQQDNLG